MTSDSTTSHRLIEDAVGLIVSSFSEVVPTEAQLHLLNAQRELLLALTVVVEHNISRSVKNPRGKPKRKAATKRKPSKITID
jgi:hypothetical protein